MATLEHKASHSAILCVVSTTDCVESATSLRMRDHKKCRARGSTPVECVRSVWVCGVCEGGQCRVWGVCGCVRGECVGV